MPRHGLVYAVQSVSSGQMVMTQLMSPLRSGVTYTSISFLKGSTNLANQTNQWFCLLEWNGTGFTVLRSTVNDTTAAWTASTVKTLALSSTYTPGADVEVWIGCVMTTSTGTTGLNLTGVSVGTPAGFVANLSPKISAYTTSPSYTTPLADATTVAVNSAASASFYGYVS
jgi:hypothetical protein